MNAWEVGFVILAFAGFLGGAFVGVMLADHTLDWLDRRRRSR